jgi:hypothetical protein
MKTMMSGKTTPPTPPAVQATPVANARLFENQCPTAAMLGLNRRDAEMPPRTPKVSRNW